MFEKVNPSHPDKLADRIAGALVDLAYEKKRNPKIAVEVLLGHGKCSIIAETSIEINEDKVISSVKRITGNDGIEVEYREYKQDPHLSDNQKTKLRCGDNGIFKGVPTTAEQKELSNIAHQIYWELPHDGKYILNKENNSLIVCQSNAGNKAIMNVIPEASSYNLVINPLGYWTGGINVDSGATNRKLGSDMGDAVTGGGLHGKDLTKADVSVNIYAYIKAQKTNAPVELYCAIGDETIDGLPYVEIVNIARQFIEEKGGFEKFAEWGLL